MKASFSIGKVVSSALSLFLKNKHLWWLGMAMYLWLLSVLSYYYSSIGALSDKYQNFISSISGQEGPAIMKDFWVISILSVILFLFSFWAYSALILSLDNIHKGCKINLMESFEQSRKYFGKVLGSFMIISAALLFFLAILYVSFLNLSSIGFKVNEVAIVISILFLIIAFFLFSFSSFYVIITKINLKDALKNSYILFKNKWRDVLIIMGVIALAFILFSSLSSAIVLPFVVILSPFILLGAGFSIPSLLLIGFLPAIIIIFFIKSISEVFIQAILIIFFKEIAKEDNPKSELEISEIVSINKLPIPDLTPEI